MTVLPQSVDALCAAVLAQPHVGVLGAGTKSGLAPAASDVIGLAALTGIVEHTPEECTFTALAGTPVADIERRLLAHGQHLPFDPPFVDAGATIGGTVAAGLNGSCRLRYGSIRDFLIGARIVDGRGTVVRSGGTVVKNAAGFLLHQAMIGSLGRFGILADLTFKVFPRAEAYATIRAQVGSLGAALETIVAAQRGQFDLEAADIEGASTVWLRIGGFAESLAPRIESIRRTIGVSSDVLEGSSDEAAWHDAREMTWVPDGAILTRVPLTAPQVPRLDTVLAGRGASRRYALAGHVVWIAWPDTIERLSHALASLHLVGQVVRGPRGHALVGAIRDNEFGRRVASVMDPEGRFAP